MWLAPLRSIQQAVEAGRLGTLNPLPWAFMLGNCCGWVTYSILKRDFFIFFANIFGLILSVYYNLAAVKLQFHGDRSVNLRRSIVTALQHDQEQQSKAFLMDPLTSTQANSLTKEEPDGNVKIRNTSPATTDFPALSSAADYAKIVWEVAAQKRLSPAPHEKAVLFMVVLWIGTISLIVFADSFSSSVRENIVGGVVIGNLVFFYGAPLSTIAAVVKTRCSDTIHVPTAITNAANGTLWCAYGIAVSDYLIAGPNGLGAALGGLQIALLVMFPRQSETVSAAAIEMAPVVPLTADGSFEMTTGVGTGAVIDDLEDAAVLDER
jgi:solute carrier family 50 protein (sugar transporter)